MGELYSLIFINISLVFEGFVLKQVLFMKKKVVDERNHEACHYVSLMR